MEFKVGDVVRLKSGGPKMTVSGLKRNDGLWTVEYFVDDEWRSHCFEPEMLALVEDDEGFYDDNDPRVEVAESFATDTTLDDLLVSRPGGVVRTKQPGGINWQERAAPDRRGELDRALHEHRDYWEVYGVMPLSDEELDTLVEESEYLHYGES